MMRSALFVLIGVTACAVAVPPTGGPANEGADANDVTHPDGSSGSCATPFSGVLATWSFTSETGSQSQTSAASSATGVTAGMFTRASGLTSATGAGSINSTNWPTASQRDMSKYYAATLTPPSGCTLALTSMSIDVKSSASGPATAVVATAADGYAQTTSIATSAPSTTAISVTGSHGLEIRVYGYGATSTGGTMRIQNTFTASGSLQ